LLKLQVKPFIDAAEQFIEWAKANTAKKPVPGNGCVVV